MEFVSKGFKIRCEYHTHVQMSVMPSKKCEQDKAHQVLKSICSKKGSQGVWWAHLLGEVCHFGLIPKPGE